MTRSALKWSRSHPLRGRLLAAVAVKAVAAHGDVAAPLHVDSVLAVGVEMVVLDGHVGRYGQCRDVLLALEAVGVVRARLVRPDQDPPRAGADQSRVALVRIAGAVCPGAVTRDATVDDCRLASQSPAAPGLPGRCHLKTNYAPGVSGEFQTRRPRVDCL